MLRFRSLPDLAIPAACPGVLIALIVGVVFLLPLDGKRSDYLGLAYLLFFPFLVLLGMGLVMSLGCLFQAIEKKRGIGLSALMLLLYSIPFLAMLGNFFH